MLPLVAVFLLVLLAMAGRSRGPLRVFALAWLICVVPLVTGLVSYPLLPYQELTFALTLIGFLSCFVLGTFLCEATASSASRPSTDIAVMLINRDYAQTLPVARLCWWIAIVGTAFLSIDFFALEGAGLDDISALRDLYVGMSSASIYAKLASVMTWGCVYCLGFALTYRAQLRRRAFVRFLLPIIGFFLLSVFSAGRQAAFQIMVFTLVILWMNKKRMPKTNKGPVHGALFPLLISLLMVAYMGYIAVARNDERISADKVEVLSTLFDLHIDPTFDAVLLALGTGLRTTVVEGIVYFSSPIGLFSKFLGLSIPDHFFGAMSFPFVFRQLEPYTGISVADAYMVKVNAMASAGAIGVGWTTAISSHMMDFGVIGTCLFLLVLGYYSAHTWFRAMSGYSFNDGMIASIMLVVALYTPMVPGFSDTNILLLWLFCVAARRRPCYSARKLNGGRCSVTIDALARG